MLALKNTSVSYPPNNPFIMPKVPISMKFYFSSMGRMPYPILPRELEKRWQAPVKHSWWVPLMEDPSISFPSKGLCSHMVPMLVIILNLIAKRMQKEIGTITSQLHQGLHVRIPQLGEKKICNVWTQNNWCTSVPSRISTSTQASKHCRLLWLCKRFPMK